LDGSIAYPDGQVGWPGMRYKDGGEKAIMGWRGTVFRMRGDFPQDG